MDDRNPYRVPLAPVADVGPQAELESIRLEHLSVETSLRSVGTLYYLGVLVFGIAGLTILGSWNGAAMIEPAVGAVVLVVAVLCAVVGRGLRGLKPWVRVPAIGSSVIGLLGFPVGTILNSYVLYLLLSAKGRRVLQPDYAALIAATPGVRYRASLLLQIGALVIVAALIAAIVLPGVTR